MSPNGSHYRTVTLLCQWWLVSKPTRIATAVTESIKLKQSLPLINWCIASCLLGCVCIACHWGQWWKWLYNCAVDSLVKFIRDLLARWTADISIEVMCLDWPDFIPWPWLAVLINSRCSGLSWVWRFIGACRDQWFNGGAMLCYPGLTKMNWLVWFCFSGHLDCCQSEALWLHPAAPLCNRSPASRWQGEAALWGLYFWLDRLVWFSPLGTDLGGHLIVGWPLVSMWSVLGADQPALCK